MNEYRPHMLPKVRSKPYMDEMKFLPCTLRISSFIPGHRCSEQGTVVGCHSEIWGKGQSTKTTDAAVFAACFNCHELVDRRDPRIRYIEENYPAAVPTRVLHAVTETQAILIKRGIIKIKGMRIVE